MSQSSKDGTTFSTSQGARHATQDIQRTTCASQGTQALGPAPAWVQDSIWQRYIRGLHYLSIAPSILEVCAGAGTASIALKLLLGPDKMRVAGAWDTDPELSGIHDVINGEDAHTVHLGQQAGDILTTELTTFPSANILVAGPPCPPFSSCGKRMALEDSRSQPFKRCVDILEELDTRARPVEGAQGHHDELMFFLLENVMGINFVSHFNQPTALETLLDELRGRLGSTWLVQFVKANAWNYGLPQNRPRIYIVGRKTKFYTEYIPRGPQHFERRVRAARLLDKLDNKAPSLTTLQEQCLKQWKRHYRTSMSNTAYLGKVAFVEGGRDPSGRTVWASTTSTNPPHTDKCQCLRASGPMMHVFALGEGSGLLSLDRLLRVRERASLQGFPDIIGQLPFTERVGQRVFGNAMSVPVVGSLMAVELLAIQASWDAAASRAKCNASPTPCSSGHETRGGQPGPRTHGAY